MQIRSFADLLVAAGQQPDAQRLLFVFVAAEAPANATPEQQARLQQKTGGYLAPQVCVDKLPAEIASFAALAEESQATGKPWDLVFVAGMGGRGQQAPSSQDAEPMLRKMVDSIKGGSVGNFLAFDRAGDPVRFN